jgi:hypothetical protein
MHRKLHKKRDICRRNNTLMVSDCIGKDNNFGMIGTLGHNPEVVKPTLKTLVSVEGDRALDRLLREEKRVSTFYFGRLFFVNSDWSGAGHFNRLPTFGSNSGWGKGPESKQQVIELLVSFRQPS